MPCNAREAISCGRLRASRAQHRGDHEQHDRRQQQRAPAVDVGQLAVDRRRRRRGQQIGRDDPGQMAEAVAGRAAIAGTAGTTTVWSIAARKMHSRMPVSTRNTCPCVNAGLAASGDSASVAAGRVGTGAGAFMKSYGALHNAQSGWSAVKTSCAAMRLEARRPALRARFISVTPTFPLPAPKLALFFFHGRYGRSGVGRPRSRRWPDGQGCFGQAVEIAAGAVKKRLDEA